MGDDGTLSSHNGLVKMDLVLKSEMEPHALHHWLTHKDNNCQEGETPGWKVDLHTGLIRDEIFLSEAHA